MENKMITEQQLINNIEKAIQSKTEDRKRLVRILISSEIGYWDDASRYYVYDEYITESLSMIRKPSRAWNLSYYKHIMSKKFLKQLQEKLEKQ